MSSILIVDDEIDYCLELKKGLSKAGYKITIANSVSAAINMTDSTSFDILLVDMMLKDQLNGIALAEAISLKSPNIKTVLMSGFLSSDTRQNAAASMALGFIEKPFRIGKLISILERVQNCSNETT